MGNLLKWRIYPVGNDEFILVGVTGYGRKIEEKISRKNLKQIKLNTSYLQMFVCYGCCFRLWFKDADLSKPITPMRIMKKTPQRFVLDAVYCMMAEVSMFVCGFSKEVDKDYLRNTKPIAVFFNDDPNDEYGFDLDIAVNLLLKTAGGVEQSS